MTREQIIAEYKISASPAYVGWTASSDTLGADFFASAAWGNTEAEAVDAIVEDIEGWLERTALRSIPWGGLGV